MIQQEAYELILRINTYVINPIIGLLFALALVVFLWGIVEYFLQADSESARETGKRHIMYGLFGMFIMFAVFAIIQIIANTIGVDPSLLRGVGR